ncbi:spore coat protein YsxE [Sporolactobacillus sp. CPB3-1]|uniref:Spore coat protein YsxE n=1 Tax=Sporolactobacillus mangiferae TaxID=2940498 RepID=A0ABT0M6M3_9BACL|nr:spore coat protein YsxE [Sporolactobacillus mangiferae]MCL1630521.1 spore coat protein YsxE [Sporolactobacillus mangiferae]
MERTASNQINRILFYYDLKPYNYTPHGQLTRIDTIAGSFALKEKVLNDRQIRNLQTVYDLSRRLVIDAVCPLPSKYGDLVIQDSGSSWYLMPWLDETVDDSDFQERYRHLFVKAGQLHMQTRGKAVDCTSLDQGMMRVLAQRQRIWELFMYQAEHHVYPSPFEQAVLSKAFIYLENMQRARNFFSQEKNDNGKQKTLRYALCHGRLSPLHLLIENERVRLTNFENSEDGFFIVETATLFEQASAMLEPEQANWRDFYRSYQSVCPLSSEEQAFLLHFLLFPGAHARLLDQYMHATNQVNEQWFVRQWTKLCRAHQIMYTAIKKEIDEENEIRAARQAKEKSGEEGHAEEEHAET